MKKIFFLLMTLVMTSKLLAQSTNPFDATELYWYGLDFTKSKMVGSFTQFGEAGAKNGFDIRNIYFRSWNRTIVNEPEKYTLDKFFNVSKVNYILSVTEAVNQDMDAAKLMVMDSYSKELTPEDLQNAVNQYKPEQKSGTGIVFIVEKFDKYEEKGVMHVVYFDIATQKILFSKRMIGIPKGIGINNYWIKSVHNVMLDVQKQQRSWKK